jgi:hypothetical protein
MMDIADRKKKQEEKKPNGIVIKGDFKGVLKFTDNFTK